MTDPVADTARAAAERLAGELGGGLKTDVEAALHARDREARPDRYLDPISLGGLIVSVATLAWTVYKDLKAKTPTPSPDVVARTVRVELRDVEGSSVAQRDRVIDVVVAETVRADEST
jgi:hypothetical protein